MTALASARSPLDETATAPLLTALSSASISSWDSISLGFMMLCEPRGGATRRAVKWSLDDELGEEHLIHRLSPHRLVQPTAHLGLERFSLGVVEQAFERGGAQHADGGVDERRAVLLQSPHLLAGRRGQLDGGAEVAAPVGLGHVDDDGADTEDVGRPTAHRLRPPARGEE